MFKNQTFNITLWTGISFTCHNILDSCENFPIRARIVVQRNISNLTLRQLD